MSSTNRKGKAAIDGNYSTPLWTVKIILPYLPIADRILDPCAGSGNILRAISESRKPTLLAGIELNPQRAEQTRSIKNVTCLCANALLDTTLWNNPDLVIMNPPFKLAEVFTRRALHSVANGGTVAVLLRMAFAASVSRAEFWQDKLADMAVLTKRPSFVSADPNTSKGNDSADYAWFIFGPKASNRWFRLEVPGSSKTEKLSSILIV